ncbi:hypothetical protein MAR_034032 [Mya arenaria]|uniref:Uncharacterized protein n=1 Tax=Mya arenaria TaxID=6604 RepID=A0ABY7GAQ0_MYAAR|nr:hypothetical protein MAR_034032 [Mya arenaria]
MLHVQQQEQTKIDVLASFRSENVARATARTDDNWRFGYWSWHDGVQEVAKLNTTTGTVTLARPPTYGLRIGHFGEADASYQKQGGYFRFINVLEELDSPGEYYMDAKSGNLYVWMPNADGNLHTSDSIYVSVVNNCIEVRANGNDISFSDFTLEVCREYGIKGPKLNNFQLLNMEIRNTGSAKYCSSWRQLVHMSNTDKEPRLGQTHRQIGHSDFYVGISSNARHQLRKLPIKPWSDQS